MSKKVCRTCELTLFEFWEENQTWIARRFAHVQTEERLTVVTGGGVVPCTFEEASHGLHSACDELLTASPGCDPSCTRSRSRLRGLAHLRFRSRTIDAARKSKRRASETAFALDALSSEERDAVEPSVRFGPSAIGIPEANIPVWDGLAVLLEEPRQTVDALVRAAAGEPLEQIAASHGKSPAATRKQISRFGQRNSGLLER